MRRAALSLAVLVGLLSANCAGSAPAQPAPATNAFLLSRFQHEALASAFVQLASGSPKQAAARFRAVLATGTDPHYPLDNDALRGVFLADLYARNDRAAAADLAAAVARAEGAPPGGGAAARGRWKEAWSDFLRDAEPLGAPCSDATVAEGIRLAMAGHLLDARSAWRERERDAGACNVAFDPFLFANGSDTKSALTGVSYLQQGRWREAEGALIAGVLGSRTTSGYTKLFAGNVIAMHMLLAYRAHIGRGQGRYRWPEHISGETLVRRSAPPRRPNAPVEVQGRLRGYNTTAPAARTGR